MLFFAQLRYDVTLLRFTYLNHTGLSRTLLGYNYASLNSSKLLYTLPRRCRLRFTSLWYTILIFAAIGYNRAALNYTLLYFANLY